jgi:hypothetical protein
MLFIVINSQKNQVVLAWERCGATVTLVLTLAGICRRPRVVLVPFVAA